ncbi:MAG: glycine--tRNA ligase [Cyclobacteriaceae bacterium]|nr:glycine--tRNA ligase [Cyclobacteriaceae bacterium HetDA_MAG_MS6]
MAKTEEKATLKDIASHAKEYGFIYPSSEIYDGLGATYDYGPNGSLLKNNIKEYWWKAMVQLHDNIVGIDAAIFMHPTTWKASGHVDAFNDPLIDNKDSKKRYRADVLIEEQVAKIEGKIKKEVEKAAKRFGESFDKDQFVTTNPRVVGYYEKIKSIEDRMKAAIENGALDDLKQLIVDLDIADPVSGSKNWTDVRQFNLMFSTELGSLAEGANTIYLRPETAQGIFVNYPNVQKTSRMKPPFGIAQIGKAFRNEIIARQFIFRMREFEQMEMQFFIKPGEEMKWYETWKEKRIKWHKALGLGEEKYRFHDHLNLAHYANAACDIEFDFPMGFKELEGIHSRTDFDLSSHEKHSGKKLQYFDQQENTSYVPYVVETSIGLDRMFLAVMASSLKNEKLEDGSERTVMSIPAPLAPSKAAILPLINKDGLPELAEKICGELKLEFNVQYDAKDAIGRRYRRQDAVGTPFCITVDHQSLEDQSVTLRERDSMAQERVSISSLGPEISDKVSLKSLLKAL